jgi:hypothetical protein
MNLRMGGVLLYLAVLYTVITILVIRVWNEPHKEPTRVTEPSGVVRAPSQDKA